MDSAVNINFPSSRQPPPPRPRASAPLRAPPAALPPGLGRRRAPELRAASGRHAPLRPPPPSPRRDPEPPARLHAGLPRCLPSAGARAAPGPARPRQERPGRRRGGALKGPAASPAERVRAGLGPGRPRKGEAGAIGP